MTRCQDRSARRSGGGRGGWRSDSRHCCYSVDRRNCWQIRRSGCGCRTTVTTGSRGTRRNAARWQLRIGRSGSGNGVHRARCIRGVRCQCLSCRRLCGLTGDRWRLHCRGPRLSSGRGQRRRRSGLRRLRGRGSCSHSGDTTARATRTATGRFVRRGGSTHADGEEAAERSEAAQDAKSVSSAAAAAAVAVTVVSHSGRMARMAASPSMCPLPVSHLHCLLPLAAMCGHEAEPVSVTV